MGSKKKGAVQKGAARARPMAKDRGGRPRKGGKAVQVRLPDDALAKLDAWLEKIKAKPGGSGSTRSDLMRDLIVKGIAEHEVEEQAEAAQRAKGS